MVIRRYLLIGLLLLPSLSVANLDETFLHARTAFLSKDKVALDNDLEALKNTGYVLKPFVDYWALLLHLDETPDIVVQAFLDQYADFSFADRLRTEWLKKLARNGNWTLFFTVYAKETVHKDIGLSCYATLGNIHSQKLVRQDIWALWSHAEILPSQCNQVFAWGIKQGVISKKAIWARLRLSLRADNLPLALAISKYLPDTVNLRKVLPQIKQSPQWLANNLATIGSSQTRVELILYAVELLAKNNVELAIVRYQQWQHRLPLEARAFAWGRIALYAARAHHPDALHLYTLTTPEQFEANQFVWWARAALRKSRWHTLLDIINVMPNAMADEPGWRYWRARAFKETEHPTEAQAIWEKLASERNYYGYLASDELNLSSPSCVVYTPSEVELTRISELPAIQRAVALLNLNMRWEGRLEWDWAVRNFDEETLLVAAEYAYRQGWLDMAITTAEKVHTLCNLKWSYPRPYAEVFQEISKTTLVDEAWLYGIAHQESRFMLKAKSGVGAQGLMQVMPETADWIAKRVGLHFDSTVDPYALTTNIELGAHYMQHILEVMHGHKVMATAAYNAGPRRAKTWQDKIPLEAIIYIETIPFNETRNYVQKVMKNTHIYANLLGHEGDFKSRLDDVPAAQNAPP